MSSDFDIKDSIMKIHPYSPGESKIDTDFPLRQLAANEAPLGPSPKAVEAAQDSLVTANRYPDGGVWIGREHPKTALHHCSVVQAPYRSKGHGIGQVALVGPMRMAYATALAAVQSVARSLERLLS